MPVFNIPRPGQSGGQNPNVDSVSATNYNQSKPMQTKQPDQTLPVMPGGHAGARYHSKPMRSKPMQSTQPMPGGQITPFQSQPSFGGFSKPLGETQFTQPMPGAQIGQFNQNSPAVMPQLNPMLGGAGGNPGMGASPEMRSSLADLLTSQFQPRQTTQPFFRNNQR